MTGLTSAQTAGLVSHHTPRIGLWNTLMIRAGRRARRLLSRFQQRQLSLWGFGGTRHDLA